MTNCSPCPSFLSVQFRSPRFPVPALRFSRRLAKAGLLLLVPLLLGGCATPPATSGSPGSHTSGSPNTAADPLGPALAAYRAGENDRAHRLAEDLARSASGEIRPAAAYIAGLAAFRAGDPGVASRWLNQAMKADDPQLVARAQATLGLIHLQAGRSRVAARELASAASVLQGTDRNQALSAARRANRQGHHSGSSQRTGTSGQLDPAADSRSDAFTLQIGAFSSRARAESVQRTAAKNTTIAGLGQPQVTVQSSPGEALLYLVQVGSFSTRNAAAAARNRHGSPGWLVTPYPKS